MTDALYTQLHPIMRRYVARRVTQIDCHDVDDIVQGAWVTMLTYGFDERSEGENFAFALQSCRWQIDNLRRLCSRHRPRYTEMTELNAPITIADQLTLALNHEAQRRLHTVIGRIPERQGAILTRLLAGEDESTIAASLGLPTLQCSSIYRCSINSMRTWYFGAARTGNDRKGGQPRRATCFCGTCKTCKHRARAQRRNGWRAA